MLSWLATLLMLLSTQHAFAAIEITSAPLQEISEQISWCSSAPSTTINEIATNGCTFKKAGKNDLSPDFSDKVYWLRLELHNPAAHEMARWLRVGHPRLQLVSLFESNGDAIWQRTDTGLSVAVARRPLITANPTFPLALKAGESKTFYLRVQSQTPIDLTLSLWTERAYLSAHHAADLDHAMSMGAMLVIALFCLLVFIFGKDLAYLYFACTLISAALVDSLLSGIFQIYLWPAERPFDIRLMPIAGACMFFSFVLLARQFVGKITAYRHYYLALHLSLAGLLLAVLWASLLSYRAAIPAVYIAILAIQLSGVMLFFRAWRDGSRPAGYLLLGYVMLLLSLSYRVVTVFGGNHYIDISPIGHSWRILLITPAIMAALMQRSEELRDATRKAAARLRFLAQMSHEFRTPLNTMLGYAELLERGSKRVTVHEGASSIKHSGRYLLGMIDEILDHARGEEGKLSLHMSPVLWTDFIQNLEMNTKMLLREHGNRFRLIQEGDMPVALMLDERRFRQMLDILLSNANRYTRQGDITLSCTAVPAGKKRSRLTISVSDTGAGIAPEELQHIFQPFVRGSAGKASGIDGVGIGLSIVRQLANLMGGEISVESRPGQGSRFWFEIECGLAEMEEAAPVPPSRRGRLLHPRTILVIDDDPNNCSLIFMLLSDYGFNIITAQSGNAARQYLDAGIHLVITDQFMPDGNGWSVLQDWSVRHVPVILLSAAPPQPPHNWPQTLDFACIQLKPVNADALLDAIDEILAPEWEAVAEIPPPVDAQRPPHELLAPLREMIEAGAVTDIEEWLKTFSEQYPEYRDYGTKIAACNLMLDFATMRSLATGSLPDL